MIQDGSPSPSPIPKVSARKQAFISDDQNQEILSDLQELSFRNSPVETDLERLELELTEIKKKTLQPKGNRKTIPIAHVLSQYGRSNNASPTKKDNVEIYAKHVGAQSSQSRDLGECPYQILELDSDGAPVGLDGLPRQKSLRAAEGCQSRVGSEILCNFAEDDAGLETPGLNVRSESNLLETPLNSPKRNNSTDKVTDSEGQTRQTAKVVFVNPPGVIKEENGEDDPPGTDQKTTISPEPLKPQEITNDASISDIKDYFFPSSPNPAPPPHPADFFKFLDIYKSAPSRPTLLQAYTPEFLSSITSQTKTEIQKIAKLLAFLQNLIKDLSKIRPPKTHSPQLNGKIFWEQAFVFLGRIKFWLRICRLFRNCKNRQILPANFRDFFEVEKRRKSSAIMQFLKIFQ